MALRKETVRIEETAFKQAVAYVLSVSEVHLAQLISKRQCTEIHNDCEEGMMLFSCAQLCF